VKPLLRRLLRLEAAAQPPPPPLTDAQRSAWCLAHGFGPDWVLLGGPAFVVLPPLVEE
jgi:hypothetical protein